jgi:DNA-directed RNA polymerase beta' subunit
MDENQEKDEIEEGEETLKTMMEISEKITEAPPDSCPVIFISSKDKRKIEEIMLQEMREIPEVEIESSLITVFDQDEIPYFAKLINKVSDPNNPANTLNDPELGVSGPNQFCSRCLKDNFGCPGHFGYIELNEKFIHPLFTHVVFNILKSVCTACGTLYLTEEYIEKKFRNLSGFERLEAIAKDSEKIKQCRNVNCQRVPLNFLFSLYETQKKIVYQALGQRLIFTMKDLEKVLKSLDEKTIRLLGFQNGAHPKNLILKRLLVLPPCDRPQVILAGKVKPEEDSLTKQYEKIIGYNNEIVNAKDEAAKTAAIEKLHTAIKELIDKTDNSAIASAKGKTISIKQRIQGKEALIRGAIMGKKVNYFGRTVLSADPSLRYGQISIPEEWRSILTKPEVVTSFNINYLKSLLRQGKISYVVKRRERHRGKIPINPVTKRNITLEIGDIVDRWLEDGDFVLFGRHPTLHKQSMMGYEIVFKPQRTIGFNPSFAAPHNLDFDGDEGNVHVPQTQEAIVEVQEVANAKYCIMNAQSNNPVVGIAYDALSGVYMLTQDTTEIEETLFKDMMNRLSHKDYCSLEERMNQLGRPYKIHKGKEKYKVYDKSKDKFEELEIDVYAYTGKAAFSALLPEDFYYTKGKVTIVNGVLIQGEITKDHVGESHGSIIQAIWKDYGPGRAADFLSDTTFLVNRWLQTVSLTVSIKDCTIQDKSIEDKIISEYESTIRQVETILGRGQLIDPIEKERQEKQVIAQLQDYKTKIGKTIQQNLSPDNSFSVMITSKAKGNEAYIAQIMGTLGQQFIMNKRAPMTISNGKRCLAYFSEDDLNPKTRGFCISSFMKGLSPAELFFHQAASREGILDTAIKTSETGTIFRRIVKSLENLVVSEDLSVRILDKKVIQFIYGEDGFNPESLEHVQTKKERFLSFINLKRLASRLNRKYGYVDVKQEVLEETVAYTPKEVEENYDLEFDEEEEED